MNIRYRFMKQGEEAEACALIKEVFNECVAPDYGQEGVHEFFRYANQDALMDRLEAGRMVMVAEEGPDIIGVIEVAKNSHISLFFVSRRGKGVGKELVRTAIEECRRREPGLKRVTVNSSPYAEKIYAGMGFRATGPSQVENGIIFVPMALDLS